VHVRDVTWGRGEAKDPHGKVTEGWVPSEVECQPHPSTRGGSRLSARVGKSLRGS